MSMKWIGVCALLWVGAAPHVLAGGLDDQEKQLNRIFGDKPITAKIDLPLIRSVYVTPQGNVDQERYRKRLLKRPPSILQGEAAKLTKIIVKKDVVHVLINRGGVPGFSMGPGSKVIGNKKKVGSRIEIEFGRKVEPQDLTQEMLLTAVSSVIAIEGFQAPVEQARPDEVFDTTTPVTSGPVETPAADIAVALLSAEVQPLKLRPGQQVSLMTVLEVSGLASGDELDVTLTRQLLFDGQPLFSEPRVARERWGNGRHTSTFNFDLPQAAAPGVYTYVTRITQPTETEEKETLFVIE